MCACIHMYVCIYTYMLCVESKTNIVGTNNEPNHREIVTENTNKNRTPAWRKAFNCQSVLLCFGVGSWAENKESI